ncbi:Dnmt3b [Symbiodinium sp. CCMP2592]|nr:Dnmt3b [Symbiodinium sp. CCMP2592]
MHPDVSAVAKDRKPALITLMAHLMRWPDTTLGLRFFTGFKLLGVIGSPGICRELHEDGLQQLGLQALLGEHAKRIAASVELCLPRFPYAAEAKGFTLEEELDSLLVRGNQWPQCVGSCWHS